MVFAAMSSDLGIQGYSPGSSVECGNPSELIGQGYSDQPLLSGLETGYYIMTESS